MKFKPIRIAIEQDPRAVLLEPVEWLRITFAFDKKAQAFRKTAWPEASRHPDGVRTGWFDRHFPCERTLTSSGGITPKEARGYYDEARREIAQRFGDAWDFVEDACRKWNFVVVPDYVITDEEFALLDTFDPEDL